MSTLSFKNINKIYDNNVQAVFDFNLEIADKEFVVFVGPSGCGKSTTLRMVAGLEEITSGELFINGKFTNNIAPKDRDIAMVFQNYALYPHMTVYENMAFALKLRKLPMPVYESNPEVDQILNENKLLFRQAHAANSKFKRNQNDLSLLEPRAEIYKKIYENIGKIEKLQKPVLGINEYNIAKISNVIKALNSEIVKLGNLQSSTEGKKEKAIANIESLEEKLQLQKNALNEFAESDPNYGKAKKDVEKTEKFLALQRDEKAKYEHMLKNIKQGIEQRQSQIDMSEKELEHYKTTEVPLTKLRKLTAKEIEVEVCKAADSIDLTRYLFRKPAALSGGQRQRVALGRAIVRKPKVFLMDEPLSNLDAKLRVQTRSEITKIHERVGATTIYVTHDQTEAMTMADRIVIMKDGYIQQIGTPDEVYNDPANQFVAGFIGSPAMNFIECNYSKGNLSIEFVKPTGDNLLSADVKEQKIVLKLTKQQQTILKDYEGKNIILGVRPENVHLSSDKTNENPGKKINLVCDFAELLGYELILYTYINGQKIILKTDAKNKVKTHDNIEICFNNNSLYFFDKETTKRIK